MLKTNNDAVHNGILANHSCIRLFDAVGVGEEDNIFTLLIQSSENA